MPIPDQISALSVEPVVVQITTPPGINPTTDSVQMAFLPPGQQPASGDWKTAAWDPNPPLLPANTYQAFCRAGPASGGGVIQLTAGQLYDVWVQVIDPSADVIKRCGPLICY